MVITGKMVDLLECSGLYYAKSRMRYLIGMLKVRVIFFLVFGPVWVAGQVGVGSPGNTYADALRAKYPELIYSYIDSVQTHDYSGNWDLDGDGEKDGVYFIGNGGVHLFF
jgi:hypothetical protein